MVLPASVHSCYCMVFTIFKMDFEMVSLFGSEKKRGNMQRYRLTFLGILLIVLLIACGCDSVGSKFDKYKNDSVSLNKEAKLQLLQFARATLENKVPLANSDVAVTSPYSKDAFVAVFLPGAPYILKRANSKILGESIKVACEQIVNDSKFTKHYSKNKNEMTISIHIIDRVNKVEERSYKKLKKLIEAGVYGMILVENGIASFHLPEVVIWEGWGMEGEKRILGSKMAQKQFKNICKKAGLRKDACKKAKLYRFTTVSFTENKPGGGEKALYLYRANVLVDKKITRSQALATAVKGGRNLGLNMSPEGKYGYIYYADKDSFDPNYNIVRHAGTTYSLFQLYKATGDPYFKERALKALEYLKSFIEYPEDDKDIALLQYKKRSDLGANALLALALLELPKNLLEQYPEYKELRTKLGNVLLEFQMEDGSFYKKYSQVVKGRPPSKQPMYYPGETFLAFARFFEETGNELFLNAADKAATYQLGDFKKSGTPCNWATQAYSRMYRLKPNEEYANACYSMADELLTHQWGTFKKRKLPYADFHGGFDNSWPPRSTPAASRTEALTEAYALAEFKNDEQKMENYGKAVLAAYWFDMNCQYRPENSYWLPNPNRALGGLRGSPIANDIRIDYTQHFITAVLHGLQIAEKFNGKGQLDPALGVLDVAAEKISLAEAEQRVLGMTNPKSKKSEDN